MRKAEIITGGISVGLVAAGVLGIAEYEVNTHAQQVACYYGPGEEYQVCKNDGSVNELNLVIDEDNLVFGGLGLASVAVGTAGIWLTYYMYDARLGVEEYLKQSNSS